MSSEEIGVGPTPQFHGKCVKRTSDRADYCGHVSISQKIWTIHTKFSERVEILDAFDKLPVLKLAAFLPVVDYEPAVGETRIWFEVNLCFRWAPP